MALLQFSIAMAFTKSHLEKYNRYYNCKECLFGGYYLFTFNIG